MPKQPVSIMLQLLTDVGKVPGDVGLELGEGEGVGKVKGLVWVGVGGWG
jgi:hypothetical protein